jgi:WD40 repeat protein
MISKSAMLAVGVLCCLGCSSSSEHPQRPMKAADPTPQDERPKEAADATHQDERKPIAIAQAKKVEPPPPQPVPVPELKPFATLSGHSQSIYSVLFSSEGMLLSSADRELRLWDVKNRHPLVTFPARRANSLSPDGKFWAEADQSAISPTRGCVLLWDVVNGRKQGAPRVLKCPWVEFGVRCQAFAPAGQTLAVGGAREVKLWDMVSGKELDTWKGHAHDVLSLAFSKDGKTLAAGSYYEVKLWDVIGQKELATWKDHSGFVQTLIFSDDSKLLVARSNRMNLWDERDKDVIRIWDVQKQQERVKLQDPGRWVPDLTFSPDNKTLLTAGSGAVKQWSLDTGKVLATFELHASDVAFLGDGKTLAAASLSSLVALKLWDFDSREEKLTLAQSVYNTFTRSDLFFLSFAQSQDKKCRAHAAKWVDLGLFGSGIRADAPPNELQSGVNISLETPGQKLILKGHTNLVTFLIFSPDGKFLASGSLDKTVNLWDVATGKKTATLTGHKEPILCLAFSSDGKVLASGSKDNTIKIWDPVKGTNKATLEGHSKPVLETAWSPDGKTLASASEDSTIRLWDIASGQSTAVLLGHSDGVCCLAFSPDGKTLASGSRDKTIKLWDVPLKKN